MKIETNEEVARILTEARGKCWHKLRRVTVLSESDMPSFIECSICEEENVTNPSPTTSWADYGEVIEWAKSQEWWNKFIASYETKKKLIRHIDWTGGSLDYSVSLNPDIFLLDPEKGSHALAEFINERKVNDV